MATTMKPMTGQDSLAELRHDRDRFVALAFSSADMLVELDRDRRIVFTAGATGALLGADARTLYGRDFAALVAAQDRPMVSEALAVAAAGTRINGLVCHLEGEFGKTPPLMMLGYQVPDLDGHFFLSLRLGAKDLGAFAAREAAPLADSGLPRASDFAQLAGQKLAELAGGEDCKLTMLRLGDLDALRGRLDEETRNELEQAIGGALRASALGGELAGELGPESYGLVHHLGANLAALTRRIEDLTRNADPERRGVGVSQASVDLDRGGNPKQAAEALTYIFTRFAESDPDEFPIATLGQGLGEMMSAAESRIGEFRGLLKQGSFHIAFQPVVDLATQRPHHFEALARFPHLPPGTSPYETITFAEQTGMIRDFDLAMCGRVLEWLDHAGRQGQRYKVAVNLSGTSIASKPFVMELHKMLKQFRGQAESVIFEITESAKIKDLQTVNATVQTLRRAGHKVCLDDFGAGSAAFQYLRDLEVDVVKIDGAYVKGALKTEKGMAFLRAMAGLCNDLGITTVAEMVEDRQSLNFLRDCGVGYGQGYLFGRPSLDISSFDAPRPSDFGNGRKRPAGGL